MNDIWRFNATSEKWSWLSGNYTTATQPQVYAQVGVSNASNSPASRFAGAIAQVSGTNKFFIFGGIGNGVLADTWMFDLSTLQWTFYSLGYAQGLYGAVQYPGDRFAHSMIKIPGTDLIAMVILCLCNSLITSLDERKRSRIPIILHRLCTG